MQTKQHSETRSNHQLGGKTNAQVQPEASQGRFSQATWKARFHLGLVSPADISLLQRTVGNQAVMRLRQNSTRDRLSDREETVQFTHNGTYEKFESDVKRWVARHVLSRTRGIHREQLLVPSGSLRGYYNSFRPGQTISLRVHFESNGYSFRKLTFIIPGDHIVISLDQEKPESSSQPKSNSVQVPQDVDPSLAAEQEIQDELKETVRDTIRDEIAEKVLPKFGLGFLAEIVSIVGWIMMLKDIGAEILAMPTYGERDRAKGFGAAVFANRVANYAFTKNDQDVIQAARQYMSTCLHSEHKNHKLIGEFISDVLRESNTKWTELRAKLDAEKNEAKPSSNELQFRTEAQLANYIIERSRHQTSGVEMWMDKYHQAWRSSHSFFLKQKK